MPTASTVFIFGPSRGNPVAGKKRKPGSLEMTNMVESKRACLERQVSATHANP